MFNVIYRIFLGLGIIASTLTTSLSFGGCIILYNDLRSEIEVFYNTSNNRAVMTIPVGGMGELRDTSSSAKGVTELKLMRKPPKNGFYTRFPMATIDVSKSWSTDRCSSFVIRTTMDGQHVFLVPAFSANFTIE